MEPVKTPQIVSKSPVKFTDEELSSLTNLKAQYEALVNSFGQLYLQRKELDSAEESLLKEKSEMEARELAFQQSIIQKYGEGTFDPKTGVYTPKQ